MLDILLELLAYLGIRAFKKKKNEDKDLTSTETIDRDQEQDHSGSETRDGISVCAGCNHTVEKGVIYEIGKTWCKDCYKSHVLKVQE